MNFFLLRVVLRIKCTKNIIISVAKSQIQVKNRRESSNKHGRVLPKRVLYSYTSTQAFLAVVINSIIKTEDSQLIQYHSNTSNWAINSMLILKEKALILKEKKNNEEVLQTSTTNVFVVGNYVPSI